MKTYEVTITGRTPLLMHHDNIDWADYMSQWKDKAENKSISKAGDDRSPAWRWLGCVYHDGEIVCIPQANIMKSLMEGGAMVPVPGGKSGKTFKSQTQSGMMSKDPYWPLLINGESIKWPSIEALKDSPADGFSVQKQAANALGFDLMVKRAAIGSAKHVRVRPIFAAGWVLKGSLAVWDNQITREALASIFEYAGQYKGIGDWRPGAPKKPGPYGTFEAQII